MHPRQHSSGRRCVRNFIRTRWSVVLRWSLLNFFLVHLITTVTQRNRAQKGTQFCAHSLREPGKTLSPSGWQRLWHLRIRGLDQKERARAPGVVPARWCHHKVVTHVVSIKKGQVWQRKRHPSCEGRVHLWHWVVWFSQSYLQQGGIQRHKIRCSAYNAAVTKPLVLARDLIGDCRSDFTHTQTDSCSITKLFSRLKVSWSHCDFTWAIWSVCVIFSGSWERSDHLLFHQGLKKKRDLKAVHGTTKQAPAYSGRKPNNPQVEQRFTVVTDSHQKCTTMASINQKYWNQRFQFCCCPFDTNKASLAHNFAMWVFKFSQISVIKIEVQHSRQIYFWTWGSARPLLQCTGFWCAKLDSISITIGAKRLRLNCSFCPQLCPIDLPAFQATNARFQKVLNFQSTTTKHALKLSGHPVVWEDRVWSNWIAAKG